MKSIKLGKLKFFQKLTLCFGIVIYMQDTCYAQLTSTLDTINIRVHGGRCFILTDKSINVKDIYALGVQKTVIKSANGQVKLAANFDTKNGQFNAALFKFYFQDSLTTDTVGIDMEGWAAGASNIQIGQLYSTKVTFYDVNNPTTNFIQIPITLKVLPEYNPVKMDYYKKTVNCRNYALPHGGYYNDSVSCTINNMLSPQNTTFVPNQGETYTDFNFGTKVNVITEPGSYHEYSQPTAMSTNGKYIIAKGQNGVCLYDTLGVRQVSNLNFNNAFSSSTVMWDCYSDDYVYFFRGSTKLIKYKISTQTDTVLFDFSQPPYNFTRISNGGSSDLSKDNWLCFWGHSAPVDQYGWPLVVGSDSIGKVVAVDLNTLNVYTGAFNSNMGGLPLTGINYIMISKGKDVISGKRYIVLSADLSLAVYEIDEQLGKINFVCRGPEDYMKIDRPTSANFICDQGEACIATPHGDTYEDDKGNQYFIAEPNWRGCPQSGGLSFYKLRDGIKMRQPVEFGGGAIEVNFDYSSGISHIGASRKSPFIVISMFSGLRSFSDTSNYNVLPYSGELVVAGISNDSVYIRRVAKSRNITYGNYFDQLHGCISDNGDYVIWTSNFGNQKSAADLWDPVRGRKVAIASTGYNKSLNTSIKRNANTNDGLLSLSLSPNPSAGNYTYTIKSSYCKETLLNVFDLNGNLLKSELANMETGELNLNQFVAGMYFIQVKCRNSSIMQKVIKMQ